MPSYLTNDPIDFAALTERVRSPHAGGVVLFLGTVRDLTGDDRTLHLDYAAYPPMAEKKIAAVEADVRARWPVIGVAIMHRVGRVAVGEIAVAVAVSCAHRAEAFAAARHAIDRVKELVPIWKHDTAPSGATTWIDPAGTPPPGAEK